MTKRSLQLLILFITFYAAGQEIVKPYEVEVNYFYGSILKHSKDISSLITGHPEGFILSYNRKTYGVNAWESRYNYPDWGFDFAYQDLKNEDLGSTYNFLAHYNFYFFKRKLMFRVGQGVGLITNPFDIDTNISNNAYGSRIFSSTMFMINYKQSISKDISAQAGLSFLHGSNGNSKAPNTGTNTVAFNIGVVYKDQVVPKYLPSSPQEKLKKPFQFNLSIQSGINQSDYIGLEREPFFVFTAMANKALNTKSTLVGGAEFFLSKFLKHEIEFLAAAFPQFGVTKDQDWKRAGIFVGHELRFDKIAWTAHLGYYIYYPYDYQGRFYQRLGLKRFFGDKYFGTVAVKTHGAKAEAVEFGLGFRL